MIYIGQYHGISAISKAIRLFTWSDISHTSAFLPDMETIIEAWQHTGVIKRPWREGHEPGTVINIYSVDCTDEQTEKFYLEMEKARGIQYDYMGIIGFLAREKMHDKDRLFCSELVFRSALRAGIILLDRIKPYQVSPGILNLSPLLKLHHTVTV